jgi:hypothetical protein
MLQLDPKLQFRETRALKYKEAVGYASRTFIELEKWYAVRTIPSLIFLRVRLEAIVRLLEVFALAALPVLQVFLWLVLQHIYARTSTRTGLLRRTKVDLPLKFLSDTLSIL